MSTPTDSMSGHLGQRIRELECHSFRPAQPTQTENGGENPTKKRERDSFSLLHYLISFLCWLIVLISALINIDKIARNQIKQLISVCHKWKNARSNWLTSNKPALKAKWKKATLTTKTRQDWVTNWPTGWLAGDLKSKRRQQQQHSRAIESEK